MLWNAFLKDSQFLYLLSNVGKDALHNLIFRFLIGFARLAFSFHVFLFDMLLTEFDVLGTFKTFSTLPSSA